MKMEFIFDEEKLRQEGYTKEQCLNVIRNHFSKLNRHNTIREISEGVFEGTDSDYGAFGSTAKFPHSQWFLKVIKKWYWYLDEGDGRGEQRGDMLASYYKIHEINSRSIDYEKGY